MSGNEVSRRKAQERARLAEELRANLQRRKAQARSRREGEADDRPEGLDAAKQEVPTVPAKPLP